MNSPSLAWKMGAGAVVAGAFVFSACPPVVPLAPPSTTTDPPVIEPDDPVAPMEDAAAASIEADGPIVADGPFTSTMSAPHSGPNEAGGLNAAASAPHSGPNEAGGLSAAATTTTTTTTTATTTTTTTAATATTAATTTATTAGTATTTAATATATAATAATTAATAATATTTTSTSADRSAIGAANDAVVPATAAAQAAATTILVPSTFEPMWLAPVFDRLTQGFGTQADGSYHDAVDIRASIGTEIAAPADLRVVYIGYRTNAGRFMIADVVRDNGSFDGDGYQLTFAHLSHTAVFEGQRVARGELLGLSGISGSVTGPHLHFRVERVVGGAHTPVDPLQFFGLPDDSPSASAPQ